MISGKPEAGRTVAAAYSASAFFGAFWGTWGASVPRIREQAGVDDGQLGIALLFVGAGALPAMLLSGRALDRWGLRLAASAIIALGVTGLVVSTAAHGFLVLCVGLSVVGATSGAADVAMNAIAGRAERISGSPIILRSSAVFSVFVVIASIATGASFGSGAPVFAPFMGVVVLSLGAAATIWQVLPVDSPALVADTPRARMTGRADARPNLTPLLLIGALGALAFASENAHQSWGAVFLEDELGAAAGVSALGPAVFAGVVAITRFSLSRVQAGHERMVLVLGSLTAASGALVIAASPTVALAVAGLVLAAAGTAALYPSMLSLVSRTVDESHRGRATATVATVSYLGFLLGPVYVGLWAGSAGLRGAMIAVAALGLALTFLSTPLLRIAGYARVREKSCATQ